MFIAWLKKWEWYSDHILLLYGFLPNWKIIPKCIQNVSKHLGFWVKLCNSSLLSLSVLQYLYLSILRRKKFYFLNWNYGNIFSISCRFFNHWSQLFLERTWFSFLIKGSSTQYPRCCRKIMIKESSVPLSTDLTLFQRWFSWY